MELRVLQYFLAVCQEESISKAAQTLYLSQPTLSRQLKDLEKELGKQLFIRGNRKIALTEEGMLLRTRAEEILTLVGKTKNDIISSDEHLTGEVVIGSAETRGVKELVTVMKSLQNHYPALRFSIISGDETQVLEQLENGLIDTGIISGTVNNHKYQVLPLHYIDHLGLLMRKDDPLSQTDAIHISDLKNLPLIISRQMANERLLEQYLHLSKSDCRVVAKTNLLFNASLMVEEGLGYCLCYEGIIHTDDASALTFKSIEPAITFPLKMVWKSAIQMSKPTQKFIDALTNYEKRVQ